MRTRNRVVLVAAVIAAGLVGFAVRDRLPGAEAGESAESSSSAGTTSSPDTATPVARGAPIAIGERRAQVVLPPVEAPAAETVRTLLPMIHRSPQAACRVAFELFRCVFADASLGALMQSDPSTGPDMKNPHVAGAAAEMHARTASCKDIPGEQLDRVWEAQHAAFYSGTPEVQRWVFQRLVPPDVAGPQSRQRIERDRRLHADYARAALARRDFADLQNLLLLYTPGAKPSLYSGSASDDGLLLALIDLEARTMMSPSVGAGMMARNIERTPAVEAERARWTKKLNERPWTPAGPSYAPADLFDALWGMDPASCALPSKA